MTGYDYIREPSAIYAESFALCRAATDLSRFPVDMYALVLRLVHSVGRPAVADNLVWDDAVVTAASTALKSGKPVLCDVRMVADGVIRSRLPLGSDVLCTLGFGSTAGIASRLGTTRSAAAVELWKPWLDGAVVAIGNAPTALFHLLERLDEGWPKPAAILGFPVGFVGAAESKAALVEAAAADRLNIPYITLQGRDGGSALAAAAVNALAGTGSEAA
ncbi:MAG: precorrin-8X methylmutase [Alphaproteobacteria bacterium]